MYEQLSLFPIESDYPKMTLEEMKSHEWVVAWSGGKDSTATVILMHELGVPIKYIVFTLMMYDENIPAILPEMYEFILRAKGVFESWDYEVLIKKSQITAKEKALARFSDKTVYKYLVGELYGMRAFLGGGCTFQKYKELALRDLRLEKEYQMVGYAADETARLHRLTKKTQSILCTQNVYEQETYEICRKYDLLSPLYDMGFSRDGCWFCPNCSNFDRQFLRERHPELTKEIDYLISITPSLTIPNVRIRNNWIKDYLSALPADGQIEISAGE